MARCSRSPAGHVDHALSVRRRGHRRPESHCGLVQGVDSNFYGTTSSGRWVEFVWHGVPDHPGGTLTTLYQFGSLPTDGINLNAGLVRGADGNFSGTTPGGGTNGSGGTVFQITPAGTLTTLYQFGGLPTDGLAPSAALVQGTDGNFYGTTELGGTNGSNGTVFQITPAGTFTTLYQFGSLPTDGLNPAAPLLQGSDGDFYGTTASGGTNTVDGTLFKITPAGTLTTLYQFGGVANDGLGPFAGLVQPTNGLFYGTTTGGGSNNDGTVFQFDTGCL